MKPDKLTNLLQELDKRLYRAEKSVSDIDQKSDVAASVIQHSSTLRAEIRRHLSKIDSIRAADVVTLETRINNLRDAASSPFREFGTNQLLTQALQSIFEDRLGLLNLTAGIKIGLKQLGPEDILEGTPGQKLAAFQFAFENDNIRVVDQPLKPHDREKDIALAALDAVIEHGAYVNDELAGTNTSPRIRQAFVGLQNTLSSYANIVQVGSRAQICNRLVLADNEELSTSLSSLLIAHIETVFSALSQFEDWRTYCENAVAVNIDAGSVVRLTEGTRALVRQLRDDTNINPSIADALETVEGWVSEQEKPDNRDILSLTRTLENMWSIVTRSVISLTCELKNEARKKAATLLLAVLLVHAPEIISVVAKVPGAQWIETAYNFLKAGGGQTPPAE